jgi:Putative peptidoglycan binding domain
MLKFSCSNFKKFTLFLTAVLITLGANFHKKHSMIADFLIGQPAIANPAAPSPKHSPKPIPKFDNLQLGSKGENVKILQIKLTQLGFYQEKITDDYTVNTKMAVLEFQKSIKLDPTGIVNQKTWDELEKLEKKIALKKPQNKTANIPEKFWTQKRIVWLVMGVLLTGGSVGFVIYFARKNNFLDNPDDLDKNNRKNAEKSPSVVIEENPDILSSEPQGTIVIIESSPDNIDNDAVIKNISETPLPNTNVNSSANMTTEKLDITLSTHNEDNQNIQASENQNIPWRNLADSPNIDIIEETLQIFYLIEDLSSDHTSQRRKAIWELAQKGDSRAIQPLINLMLGADSQEYSLILEAISQISARSLKPFNRALINSLLHDNPDVRKNAVRDVSKIYDLVNQIHQVLNMAMNDPDPEVQETARMVMKKLKSKKKNKEE